MNLNLGGGMGVGGWGDWSLFNGYLDVFFSALAEDNQAKYVLGCSSGVFFKTCTLLKILRGTIWGGVSCCDL